MTTECQHGTFIAHTHTHTHTQISGHGKLAKLITQITYDCDGAYVRVEEIRKHVWSIEYFGPLSDHCFNYLRAKAIESTAAARVVLVRMDKSLMISSIVPALPEGAYRSNLAPGVIIVREDQKAVWTEYTRKVQSLGIMRVVLLPDQLALANQIVGRLSGQYC